MGRKLGVVLAGGAVLPLLMGAPAPAATGTYTIGGGVVGPVTSVTKTAFQVYAGSGQCATVAGTPVNGVDARIVDVASIANQTRSVTWSATGGAPGSAVLQAFFYDSRCAAVPTQLVPTSGAPGTTWSLKVPAGVKWAVIMPTASVNVSFTIR